ncbi:MAG TPA: hypothetical protein VMO47_08795 [Rhodothermales bacterium]|nr:hypothetical protein [Rhodothermales bacterium]
MSIWKQLFALAPLIGAVVMSPAQAQDEEWDFEDTFVYEHLLNLDRHLENLHDQLAELDGELALDFTSDFLWTDDHCEDVDECDVRVIVDDGKRLVIVNGDTVKGDPGRFAFKLGPGMQFRGHGPGLDLHGKLGKIPGLHRDSELRRLEKEARTLARKARESSDAEKAELEKELDQKLNEIFTYKLRLEEEAIERAENRVAKLKERHTRRESARDEIIESRKDELLGRDRYLEW